MISEVNILSGPGASPAGRVDQDFASVLMDAAAFSALIDEATAWLAAPDVPSPPAPAVTGVLHAAIVSEWCLCWPELAPVARAVPEGETDVEDVPEPANPDEREHDPLGAPVLNFEWLQLAPIPRPEGLAGTTAGNGTSEPAREGSSGTGSPEAVPLLISVSPTQPHGKAIDVATDVEAVASLEGTEPAVEEMSALDRPRGERRVQQMDRAVLTERATEVIVGTSIQQGQAVQPKALSDESKSLSPPPQQEYGSRPEMAGRAHTYPSTVAYGMNAAIPNDVPGASAGAAPPPPARLVSERQTPEAESLQDIVQTMRVQVRQGIGDAVVRLKPEHLGEISIQLRVEQQTVSAVIRAEVPAVRHWLELNEASLRQNLSQHGLQLDKFVVREDESRREQPEPREQFQGRRERRQPHTRQHEPEPQFELLV